MHPSPKKEKVHNFEACVITLEENRSFVRELESSVIPETINKVTVDSVSLIVEGLGFKDVKIRGINSQSFLACFYLEENLDARDFNFLEIGSKM